ncbi:hypothetical protein EG329_010680 [Mollisiaceae sp. DMI_Dod_QoI]|nr:hypothetical protein EG329_010680 [Helotiales sp. DMI_Dod_QoI]
MCYSEGLVSHILIVTFFCAAVGALPTDPNINITISVPAGTSDHGDSNLLCTPTKWFDVVVFYFANYLAHAATVKALPGESTIDLAFAVFLAITFPFSGVARGLEAIARHASFSWQQKILHCNDLQTAARAGALCIIVRTKYWDDLGSPVEEGLKQGSSTSKHLLEHINPEYRKVHGLSKLPGGYSLALLPSNACIVPNKPYDTGHPKDVTLSSSASIPQSVAAIFQGLYASYTIYKSRGDQLARYGYAAFGLTVTPYIIMSFLNLLGNISTPDYPALYLVSSTELEEAKLREDAAIDGVVGTVVPVAWDEECKDRFTGLVHQSLSHGDENSKVFFAECSPFKTVGGEPYRGPKQSSRLSAFLWWGVMVLLGTIPYAVIGGLTHFQAARSTQSQRVLTMFWLASGVFIGAMIPFISFSFHELLDIIKGSFSQQAREYADRAKENNEAAEKNVEKAKEKAKEAENKANEARADAIKAKRELGSASTKAHIEQLKLKDENERVWAFESNFEEKNGRSRWDYSSRSSGVGKTFLKPDREVNGKFTWEDHQLHEMRDVYYDRKEKAYRKDLERRAAEIDEMHSAKEDKKAKELHEAMVNLELKAKEQSEASRNEAARAFDLAQAEKDRAKAALVFLGSLVFCAGAIGGFVVVGQMLTNYGSCVTIS